MTRSEHLSRSKARALRLASEGNLLGALASLVLDLSKHPETRADSVLQTRLFAGLEWQSEGGLNTAAAMRLYIEGFE